MTWNISFSCGAAPIGSSELSAQISVEHAACVQIVGVLVNRKEFLLAKLRQAGAFIEWTEEVGQATAEVEVVDHHSVAPPLASTGGDLDLRPDRVSQRGGEGAQSTYCRVVGSRNTSDLVAGVHMMSIGINIERSAAAGFGEVGGEEKNAPVKIIVESKNGV